MKRLLAIALLSTLLLGCSSVGSPVARDDSLIQMPHYIFTRPADQGWQIERADDNFELVILTNKVGPIVFQMKFMRNLIPHPLRAQPAKVVADDFRRLEERIMIEQGVKRGLYHLNNLVKGERTLGDRTFYTMTYETVARQTQSVGLYQTQSAALYLLFPKSESNDSFVMAHYSESVLPGDSLDRSYKVDKSYKSAFEALLQGMVLR